MINLKKPEEYAAERGVFKEGKIAPMNLNLYRDGHVKSQRDIVKAIQLAQREAYNQAIDDAYLNARIMRVKYDDEIPGVVIDKKSILKLKI